MSEDYVLQLDVPMHNRFWMHILDALGNFPNDYGGWFLWKALLPFDEIIKVSLWAKFNEQVNLLAIEEEVIEFD
jgi:hypothetical protein